MAAELADEISEACPFEKEEIPDEHHLFMRVHPDDLEEDGSLKPGAFKNKPTKKDGMSTNWSKYRTAEETRLGRQPPETYCVVRMVKGDILRVPLQTVEHTPKIENQSHTDVYGVKNIETRARFLSIYEVVLKPGA